MDVRECRTVHRLPSSISRRLAERRPGSIGHITLRGKCAGARSAGKPHAACDVAGAGNGLTVRLVRHSHRKRGETDRPRLRSTAPALDPTGIRSPVPAPLLPAHRYTAASSPRACARSRALGLTEGRNGTSHTCAQSGCPGSLAYSLGSQTRSSVPTADLPTGT